MSTPLKLEVYPVFDAEMQLIGCLDQVMHQFACRPTVNSHGPLTREEEIRVATWFYAKYGPQGDTL